MRKQNWKDNDDAKSVKEIGLCNAIMCKERRKLKNTFFSSLKNTFYED